MIGGGSGSLSLPPLPPLGQSRPKPWRSNPTTTIPSIPSPIPLDPRLPQELTTQIILIAAQNISTRRRRDPINQVLSLCQVDRATHRAIFSILILPKVHLSGLKQIKAFSRSLQREDGLGIGEMAERCVVEIHISRGDDEDEFYSEREGNQASLENQRPTMREELERGSKPRSGQSLYDSVLDLSKFESSTLTHLRLIISNCRSLKNLNLSCTPLVLDPRWQGDEEEFLDSNSIVRGLQTVRIGIEELICLQTLYGGDLNEKLWINPFNWGNLKRIQLHGPRFRFTNQVARALGGLNSLVEIGLIMPLLPRNFSYFSSTSSVGRGEEESVLQVLIDNCKNLSKLLIVGHDIKRFVGNSKGYQNELHGLRKKWKDGCNCSADLTCEKNQDEELEEREEKESNLKILLITARQRNPQGDQNCHPTIFSDWMLGRARDGNHWKWDGEEGVEGESISFSVESWDCPYETPHSSGEETDSDQEESKQGQDLFRTGYICSRCKRDERVRRRKERGELNKRLEKEERERAWKERLRLVALESVRGRGDGPGEGVDNLD